MPKFKELVRSYTLLLCVLPWLKYSNLVYRDGSDSEDLGLTEVEKA